MVNCKRFLLSLVVLFFCGCGDSHEVLALGTGASSTDAIHRASQLLATADMGTLFAVGDQAVIEFGNNVRFTHEDDSGTRSSSFDEILSRVSAVGSGSLRGTLTYTVDGTVQTSEVSLAGLREDPETGPVFLLDHGDDLDGQLGTASPITVQMVSLLLNVQRNVARTGTLHVSYPNTGSVHVKSPYSPDVQPDVYGSSGFGTFFLQENGDGEYYFVTVSSESTEGVTIDTQIVRGEKNNLVMLGRRAPKGASTGGVSVQVVFKYRRTRANRNLVELREAGSSDVSWSGLTRVNGTIDFLNLPTDTSYQVTVYDDDNRGYDAGVASPNPAGYRLVRYAVPGY